MMHMDLNQLSFEYLRSFVDSPIGIMTSAYAQELIKSDEQEACEPTIITKPSRHCH